MKYNNIEQLRRILFEELKNIDSSVPIKLPYDKDLLHQLIFENGRIFDKYPILDKIDFSEVDFSGIDISNFDFTGLHGVKINPQTIKNKDLVSTICNGVEFIGPFDGVRIKKTDFTGSKGAVINPRKIFADFYGVKFADVTFEGCFVGVKIEGADFTGSNGAIIDLQSIQDKSIAYTKLSGVILKGGFQGVNVEGADFTGALGIRKLFKYEVGVKINPREVRYKIFRDVICNGIQFIGSFKNVDIRGADFTGSVGVVIDLDDRDYYSPNINLRNTKLSGVTLKGSFEDIDIKGADFTGSIGAKIDPQKVYRKDLANTICNGVEFVNSSEKFQPASFENVIVEKTNFAGSKGAIINPQQVSNLSLEGTICKDVTFIGSFDSVNVKQTDFTGSVGAKINPNKLHCDFSGYSLFETICTDAELIKFPHSFQIKDSNLDGCIYGKEIIESILVDICEKYKTGYNNLPRKEIIKELKKYRGIDKIKLPFKQSFLKLLFFDGENFAEEIEEEILMKIDFSNVSFDGFNAKGVDFSKYTGITINLDTIKNKDISDANLDGVKIIGSFEGVNKTNARLENASFEGNSFEERFREKIKVLTLQNQK